MLLKVVEYERPRVALFTVRVEMHDADSEDYDLLHEVMGSYGYRRFILGTSSNDQVGLWKLPSAEYTTEKEMTAVQVRDEIMTIANTIHPAPWCLATQVQDCAWSTEKI